MSARGPKWDSMVLASVAVAGLGIALAGAWAGSEEGDEPEPASTSDSKSDALLLASEAEFELPALPETEEEAIELYKKSRKPISRIFRIAGQMLVAPIAYGFLEKAYAAYDKSQGAGAEF